MTLHRFSSPPKFAVSAPLLHVGKRGDRWDVRLYRPGDPRGKRIGTAKTGSAAIRIAVAAQLAGRASFLRVEGEGSA